MGEKCPINKKMNISYYCEARQSYGKSSDLIGFLLGPHLAKWTVSREMVMSPVS